MLPRVWPHLGAGVGGGGRNAAAAVGAAGGGDDARHVLVAEHEPLLLQHLCHESDIAGLHAAS